MHVSVALLSDGIAHEYSKWLRVGIRQTVSHLTGSEAPAFSKYSTYCLVLDGIGPLI